MDITYTAIGRISLDNGYNLVVDDAYRRGLFNLEGFSHVLVLWHAHQLGNAGTSALIASKPYVNGPESIGVFATRSPYRPNSVCLSVAQIVSLNVAEGLLKLSWIDAADSSPILDIKPYHGSEDRVRNCTVPSWCSHWPTYVEDSEAFAWDREFTPW